MTAVVKMEPPSSNPADPSKSRLSSSSSSTSSSISNTYVPLPGTDRPIVSRNWPPPSFTQSFIRSDAPPRSVYHHGDSNAPGARAPTVHTADESEPVLMQVKHRDMMASDNSLQQPQQPQQHPSQGDSFFDGSFRDIGAKLKACNDTLGELQQLGVSHIVSLPRLVLVGDQSAGKSSLMSGLAGLNLPRSEGLDYAFEPPEDRSITKMDVTEGNPFPPWRKQNREVREFMTIYDSNKDDIETVLRWAQIAILNHHQDSDLYIPGTGAVARTRKLAEEAEATAAKFSPNTVALEIKGPDLPDLSFYDLPGIFRNSAQEEDEYLVQVVENLAREQMKQKDALVIWAVPMNADPETSSTLSIIRDLGATQRTIGVMTKADLIPNDTSHSHSQWLSMLEGTRHQIGHGYFITSRLTDTALDEQMRWEEILFCDNGHERWPTQFAPYRERCGVERLKSALSEKLGKEFAKNLPSIKKKVQVTLRNVEKSLGNLPELPANVEYEVRKSLAEYSALVKERLKGKEFSSAYGKLANDFRKCLLATRPKFTLKDPSDAPVVEISDDENEESPAQTPSSRKRGPVNAGGPAAKRARPALGVPPAHASQIVKAEDTSTRNESPVPRTPSRRGARELPYPFQAYTSVGKGFRTIRQIRYDIQAKTKAGMPNLVPDEVYEDLCKEAVQHWERPMCAFLEAAMDQVQRIIDSAFEESFSTLKRRLIFKRAKDHMKDFLRDHRRETDRFLHDLYEMERFQLFTIDSESFTHYQKVEGRLLARYRHVMRWKAFSVDDDGDVQFQDWDRMTPEQRVAEEKKHAAELMKMGPDPFAKELGVASYVRGYYRLAALRFADAAALTITSRMFPQIIRGINFYLDEKLGIMNGGAADTCRRLMDEGEATAARRENLKTMAQQLKKAEESIRGLEQETAEVNATSAVSVASANFSGRGNYHPAHVETVADSMDESI